MGSTVPCCGVAARVVRREETCRLLQAGTSQHAECPKAVLESASLTRLSSIGDSSFFHAVAGAFMRSFNAMEDRRSSSSRASLWLSLFAVSFLLPRLRHKLWMMKIWRVRSPMILLEMTEGQHECLRHFAQDSRSPEICHRDRLLKRLDAGFCLSEIHGH